jgi:hypothetical protein
MKSRRLDWAEYAVHVGGKRSQYNVLVEDKKTDHLEDIGIDGRIILKLIIKKLGLVVGFCEQGTCSIKCLVISRLTEQL